MQKTSYTEKSEKICINQILWSSCAGPEATPFASPLQIVVLFDKTRSCQKSVSEEAAKGAELFMV